MKDYIKPEITLIRFTAEEEVTGLPQMSGGATGGDDDLVEDPS